MTRTIISLDTKDKSWLEKKAAESGLPMAEIVRRAIRRLRQEEETRFDQLLAQTSGVWRRGDGLAYQKRIRRQWR